VWTTGKSHSFQRFGFIRKEACRPKLSRSRKSSHTLSPAQHHGFVGHAYAISGQKEKALKIPTQLETEAKKKAFPIISLP
jgi:hypothetical protein